MYLAVNRPYVINSKISVELEKAVTVHLCRSGILLLSVSISMIMAACAVSVVPSPLSEYRTMGQMVPSSFAAYDRTARYYYDPDRDWRGGWR